ncbi:MAG: tryptophan-rich sensory protein [Limibacillus sp.]|jgi:translocator protein
MDLTSYLALFGFIGACTLVAMSGAVFRPGQWYEELDKPDWRPPNWLFGPAWSVLYAMIAVSGWFVWLEVGFSGAVLAFCVYGVQLLLNAAWSGVFFGLRRPDLAFAELLLLWCSILANILVFFPIDAAAGWLLVPYLAWVSFAGLLNYSIWRRNGSKPLRAA